MNKGQSLLKPQDYMDHEQDIQMLRIVSQFP